MPIPTNYTINRSIKALGPMHDPRITETRCQYILRHGEQAGTRCADATALGMVTCIAHGPAFMDQKQTEAWKKKAARKQMRRAV